MFRGMAYDYGNYTPTQPTRWVDWVYIGFIIGVTAFGFFLPQIERYLMRQL